MKMCPLSWFKEKMGKPGRVIFRLRWLVQKVNLLVKFFAVMTSSLPCLAMLACLLALQQKCIKRSTLMLAWREN